MSPTYGKDGPNTGLPKAGLSSMPDGGQLLTLSTKDEYEGNPFHVYHPTPHDAITILRSKKNPHDWLVCGWYVDTLRGERGVVTGLVYRRVVEEADKEVVLQELKKHDKEGSARFSVQ